VWSLCGADNSAVLVVPNVKVRMEAQHSICRLSLRDCCRKAQPSVGCNLSFIYVRILIVSLNVGKVCLCTSA
jgi:hypothetical protein